MADDDTPQQRKRKSNYKPVDAEWTPSDETWGPTDHFVKRVVPWQGELPQTGPTDWRMVCVWLAALGKVQREGLQLRVVRGHEDLWPAQRRGRGQRVRR